MKMNDDTCRPEDIYCDALRELYKMFVSPEHRYLWYDSSEKSDADAKIMYLESATLHDEGLVLEPFPMTDIELASFKYERIDLVLKDCERGRCKEYTCSIRVDAVTARGISKEELLERHKLRFVNETELKDF